MNDKLLLFFVENYSNHENEDFRKLAEFSWELLKERGKEIERSVSRSFVTVPGDAKTSQLLLDEIMERIRKENPEQIAFLEGNFEDKE